MANILIVDDEKKIIDILVEYLQRDGHTCFIGRDGVDALYIIKNNDIDLVVLDIMMPELDGFNVCKMIKEKEDIPIIFLTAKNKEEDKLKGYNLGADDYVTKPFSPRVLLAKIQALLRRASKEINVEQDYIKAGNIYLYPKAERVICNEDELKLTHMEFKLLCFLIQNQNQVFSREQLLSNLWGYDYFGNTRTVDTHIRRIREKLGDEGKHIITLIRSGYKFEVQND
ncbi:MAG: response regulator transcription factor [Peptoniphilaceae bacterium]